MLFYHIEIEITRFLNLVITNEYIYQPFFGNFGLKCDVIFQEKYGAGEPSDDMVEAIYKEITGPHKRIIAIGGGTVIDISKIFALKNISSIFDLYDGKLELEKDKKLVLVPTTCGTGSEVTNIAILALNSRGTKKGLAVDEMYADSAVLVPELLSGLPFKFFATSSIDALVHALSYPLGATFNVPHGEIAVLNQFIAEILGCDSAEVYEELKKLLNHLIEKKALHEYGMTEVQNEEFTESVIENQGRLMANNFVELDRDRIIKIYKELF